MLAARKLHIAVPGLPFQANDVDHASQNQQEAASEGDGKRPRQSALQIPELRHQRLIGML